MAVELDITPKATATTLLDREGRAIEIALGHRNLIVGVWCVVGAPARLFLGDGVGIVGPAKVGAKAVCLIDADIWWPVSGRSAEEAKIKDPAEQGYVLRLISAVLKSEHKLSGTSAVTRDGLAASSSRAHMEARPPLLRDAMV